MSLDKNPNFKGGGRCKLCGRNIYKGRGYCSRKCYLASLPERIKKICQICQKDYYVKPSEAEKSKYCSKKCRYKADSKNFSGKNHWNWQGGITEYSSLIRNSRQYKEWREKIFEKDNYTCVLCKKRGGDLHTHHIVPFSFILKKNNIKTIDEALRCDELWDIRNGSLMCVQCHRQTFKHNKV